MAADTAQKRYSAYDLACPWRGIRVLPSGAVGAAARAAALCLYAGIPGGAVAQIVAPAERAIEVRFTDRTVRVDASGRVISVAAATRTIH